MKNVKGFKGKYFSLAAILAFSSAVNLQATSSSVKAHESELQQYAKEANDAEYLEEEELPLLVVVKEVNSSHTAFRRDESLKYTTSDVDIISEEEIKQRHFTSISDALSSLSAINVSSNGGVGQTHTLFTRGLKSQKTLFLIDGIRYNDPTGLVGADIAHIFPQNIKQIEIVKGSNSALWGADASAGVINIITNKPAKGTHGSFSTMWGSYGTSEFGVNLSHKGDKFDLSVNSNIFDTDGFSAQTPWGSDPDSFEDDEYRNYTNSVKLGVDVTNQDRLELSHTNIYAYGDADPFGNPNGNNPFFNRNQLNKISYKHSEDDFNVNTYVSRSVFDREFPTGFTNEFTGAVNEYGINTNIRYQDMSTLSIGTSLQYFNQYSGFAKGYKDLGLFTTNTNILWNDTLTFTESLRFDQFDEFSNQTTYKIGAKKEFKNVHGLSTSVNYATSYNVPLLFQLYSAFGNTALKPEKSKGFDFNIAYNDIKMTYFQTNIKDLIDFDLGTFAYKNILGKSHINGLEFSYIHNFDDWLKVNFGLTHLINSNDSTGTYLARRVKDKINLALDIYPSNNFHINLNSQYIGDRYDDAARTKQTGRYTVHNAVFNYAINKHFSTYLKVDNITNKYYQVVNGFATSKRAGYVGVKYDF